MKILKENVTKKSLATFSVRRIAQALAVGLGVLLSVSSVYGQSDKQISYPVTIPIERAAASSVAAATAYKAPEPIIRAIEDASTTPSPVRKASTKKIAVEQQPGVDAKSETTPTTKKTVSAKTTIPATKKNVNKKTASAKPEPKTVAKKAPAPSVKKAVEAPSAFAKPEQVVAQEQVSPALKAAIAPVAVNALASNASIGDEEEQLANNVVAEDDTFSPETEVLNTIATPSPIVMKNIPLPMGAQREAYIAEFKDYVETKIVPRVPGLAVAVIADGKVKILQAYGVKKVGGSDAINTDTAFRLASVSKTIAGTAAGVLVSDGLINWDTPITSVLPNVEFSNPRYGNQLTLRNIMSQSTGLPTHSGDNFIEDGLPFDEVVEKLKAVNFVCPPGKCYSYQNVTLSLLGNIIHKKTGKTYEQYVKEKLFIPLGMRSASIGLEGLLATNNYALPHEVSARGKWYTKEITQNYYRLNPAAGGNASITDMARWVLAQMGHNPEVLSPATLQAIHAKVTKNTAAQSHYGARDGVTDTHYGMGWRTFDYRGDKNFLHHGGYVFGSRSEMVFNPELQIGMVILSNCNKLPGEIIFKFLDAYEDEKRGEKTIVPVATAPVKKKAKAK